MFSWLLRHWLLFDELTLDMNGLWKQLRNHKIIISLTCSWQRGCEPSISLSRIVRIPMNNFNNIRDLISRCNSTSFKFSIKTPWYRSISEIQIFFFFFAFFFAFWPGSDLKSSFCQKPWNRIDFNPLLVLLHPDHGTTLLLKVSYYWTRSFAPKRREYLFSYCLDVVNWIMISPRTELSRTSKTLSSFFSFAPREGVRPYRAFFPFLILFFFFIPCVFAASIKIFAARSLA